jgi:hypothetical protein
MMSLEQAIKHAERACKESRNGLQYALKRGETRFAERCKKEAEENQQLAAWLRELQERRKAPEIITCGERVNFAERDFCKVAGHNVHRKSNCMQVFGAERKTE